MSHERGKEEQRLLAVCSLDWAGDELYVSVEGLHTEKRTACTVKVQGSTRRTWEIGAPADPRAWYVAAAGVQSRSIRVAGAVWAGFFLLLRDADEVSDPKTNASHRMHKRHEPSLLLALDYYGVLASGENCPTWPGSSILRRKTTVARS
jgi:hypothetical protein